MDGSPGELTLREQPPDYSGGGMFVRRGERAAFPRAFWALVPLLAVLAYLTVLRIGFMSDDLGMLNIAGQMGYGQNAFLPEPGRHWFRPVWVTGILQMDTLLWGRNPLPYHLQGLLVHAAVALTLGLLVSWLTRRPFLGWLAGALFAVFPLHTEAVGWLAAQLDTWAMLFGLLSTWAYAAWWRGGAVRAGLYLPAFVLYTLGTLTKESLFLWLPVLAAAAWYVSDRVGPRGWLKIGLSLLPFAAVVGVNLVLRLLTWGNIGGYTSAPSNYVDIFWSKTISHFQVLLAPVNSAVVGGAAAQVVGAVMTALLLVGLVLYGRRQWRLIVLAAVWVSVAAIPVLNLPIMQEDLRNNRLLYLASGGYCLLLAALAYEAIRSVPRRWNGAAVSATSLALAMSGLLCWLHLQPWHVASLQVADLEAEMKRLIPMQGRPTGLVWYVDNLPEHYRGAHVLQGGMGRTRTQPGGGVDFPRIERVPDAFAAPFGQDNRDAYGMSFGFSEADVRFHVSRLVGVTGFAEPPDPGPVVWDFRECHSGAVRAWLVEPGSALRCERGEGLVLRPFDGGEATLTGPDLMLEVTEKARFLRIRMAGSFTGASGVEGGKWQWISRGENWSVEDSAPVPMRDDGEPYVYWMFVPLDGEQEVESIRLHVEDGDVRVHWIAVDVVR